MFFQKFFPQILFFPNFFLKNFFSGDFSIGNLEIGNFLEIVQKSFLTKIFFIVAEINLTSEVHCILVLFNYDVTDAPFFQKCFWHEKAIISCAMGPPRGLEIPLSRKFVAQIRPRNCLKFVFMQTLPNHVGCQIDISHNNAIIIIQFPFSRSDICPIAPSRFPLEVPAIV